MVTDGQKRLYERLVRFAGTNGRCFPSQTTLARELGKSERQVRKDLVKLEQYRLIRHLWREGRRSNTYEFLWHQIFDERNRSAAQEREAVEPERNSASVQRKAEAAATIIDRNQDTGQLRDLSGTGPGLNGTLRPVERNSVSANIISDRDLEKASNGSGAQTGFSASSDDEQSQPPGVMATPEFVFLARMTARHGPTIDPETLLDLVKAELNGYATLAEFLEHDAVTTTAPQRLTNPTGHYRSMARRLARRHGLPGIDKTLKAVRDIMAELARQEHENSTAGSEKCPRCQQPKGKGVLVVNERFEPCPNCSTPEWAEYVRAKADADQERRRTEKQLQMQRRCT